MLLPCVFAKLYVVCSLSAIFSEDKNTTEPAHKVKNIPSIPNTPEPPTTQEPLVGSQKRKARKTKITHLVRTADGRVSPAGGSLGKQGSCDSDNQSIQGPIMAMTLTLV